MTQANPVFDVDGLSVEDAASLTAPLNQIYFPWEKLRPELDRSGVGRIRLEFADLSRFAGVPALSHFVGATDGRVYATRTANLPPVTAAHAARVQAGPRAAVAGLAWYGKIQVADVYRGNQGMVDWVMSAEIAHEVDFFHVEPGGMRAALTRIAHPDGSTDAHAWFDQGAYWDWIGEGWMSGFGLAYTDFIEPDARFSHPFRREDAAAIRAALDAERTDTPNEPEPEQPAADRYAEGIRDGRRAALSSALLVIDRTSELWAADWPKARSQMRRGGLAALATARRNLEGL